MSVMPAGMHHAGRFGGKGQSRFFLYGQGIEIGTQTDCFARFTALMVTTRPCLPAISLSILTSVISFPRTRREVPSCARR